MSHSIKQCKHGKVRSRCRCTGPHETVIVACPTACAVAELAELKAQQQYGQIVASWTATVVEQAPPRALVTLGLLASLDPRAAFVRGDRLFLGNDRQGREVIYRVTGWEPEHQTLIVERVEPSTTGDDGT